MAHVSHVDVAEPVAAEAVLQARQEQQLIIVGIVIRVMEPMAEQAAPRAQEV